MKTKCIAAIVFLCAFVLLSVLNLIWKFSTSAGFSDMGGGRQFNVVMSVILILIYVPIIIGLIILVNKSSKKEHK